MRDITRPEVWAPNATTVELLLASGPWWLAMGWMVLSPTIAVFLNNLLQGITGSLQLPARLTTG